MVEKKPNFFHLNTTSLDHVDSSFSKNVFIATDTSSVLTTIPNDSNERKFYVLNEYRFELVVCVAQ